MLRSIRMEIVETLFNEAFSGKPDQKSKDVLDYLRKMPYRKQCMTKTEFFQYVKSNHKVLATWSIFALQKAIRKKVFGAEYWTKLMQKGIEPPAHVPEIGLQENFVQRTMDLADPEKNKE